METDVASSGRLRRLEQLEEQVHSLTNDIDKMMIEDEILINRLKLGQRQGAWKAMRQTRYLCDKDKVLVPAIQRTRRTVTAKPNTAAASHGQDQRKSNHGSTAEEEHKPPHERQLSEKTKRQIKPKRPRNSREDPQAESTCHRSHPPPSSRSRLRARVRAQKEKIRRCLLGRNQQRRLTAKNHVS